jgi:hypothetical protein
MAVVLRCTESSKFVHIIHRSLICGRSITRGILSMQHINFWFLTTCLLGLLHVTCSTARCAVMMVVARMYELT